MTLKTKSKFIELEQPTYPGLYKTNLDSLGYA